MNKSYKFRIYPTDRQKVLLNKTFGCVRYVWNYNVNLFNKHDKSLPKQVKLTTTELRQQYDWMREVSACSLQQKENDFKQFKRQYFSKKRKKKIGRPQFKSKHDKQSYRLDANRFSLNEKTIKIEKIGCIEIVKDRDIPVDAKFVNVTISKNPSGEYYVSILVEEIIEHKPKTGKIIGLDIGLKTYLTGSDGLVVENPTYFRESQMKLRKAQRNLSRKMKDSNRRKKAVLKVARLHNEIANKRKHFIQTKTTELINAYDFIGIEDLNVDGMKRNRRLAKSIADAAFGEFYRVLSYKALWYGKNVVKISQWFPSSKTCSSCGLKKVDLTLKDRIFNCIGCGLVIDRDLNASHNILNEALRINSAIRT